MSTDCVLAFTLELQIALPIGFTSLAKACFAEKPQGGPVTTVAMETTKKTGVAGTVTNSNANAVVPFEESPPDMP